MVNSDTVTTELLLHKHKGQSKDRALLEFTLPISKKTFIYKPLSPFSVM